ncbi:hypothetical protein L873DRAFT_1818668 [Choiromyces venosus 120613-1]|uniref:Uncharacterized protein n=1 Tax=Choiromyces venosus 120613-1 TaxID=1336337 RepID=A0A3N4J118_9PEZI|nr:hypothetical protein L873DRAFT_1818668 [Choiromyces venosus 120613-1]
MPGPTLSRCISNPFPLHPLHSSPEFMNIIKSPHPTSPPRRVCNIQRPLSITWAQGKINLWMLQE